MFEGIGTMNSYLQMKQLRFAANYRLATGQDLNAQRKASKSLVESMLAASKTEAAQTADQAEALRTALIKQELMNGKELSDEEMRYLKEKAPDLYAKAQKAQKAREELKEELQHCRTKAEARQAVMHAMAKASAEASAELASARAMTAGGASAASMSGGGISAGGSAAGACDAGTATAPAASAALSAGGGTVQPGNVGALAGAPLSAAAGTSSAAAAAFGSTAAAGTAADATASSAGAASGVSDAQSRLTPQSIAEKFIMVVRALEDTWMKYSSSREYAGLPSQETDLQGLQEKDRAVVQQLRLKAYRRAAQTAHRMDSLPQQ